MYAIGATTTKTKHVNAFGKYVRWAQPFGSDAFPLTHDSTCTHIRHMRGEGATATWPDSFVSPARKLTAMPQLDSGQEMPKRENLLLYIKGLIHIAYSRKRRPKRAVPASVKTVQVLEEQAF